MNIKHCTVRDCNNCDILSSRRYKYLYLMLAKLDWALSDTEIKGKTLLGIVNTACPNMTCCPECRVDDFVHVE